MADTTSNLRRGLYLAATILMMVSANQIAAQTRSFNMETGDATSTLREFARQARVDVVMDRLDVQGVQTNEVSGLLEPRIALERILEGTPLVFKEDLETGAFAVTRSEATAAELTQSGSERQTSESELQPPQDTEMKTKMNVELKSWLKALTAAISLGIAADQAGLYGQDSEDGEPYTLSPFVVDAEEDQGYQATTTLAGSRLRTPLKDVGSAIQVMTKEFFEDTGATDSGTLLSYGLNTETGGAQGNFAGGGFDGNNLRSNQNEGRIYPQGNQRIRGLGEATLTRSFFLTDIPFDTYNSSRVTINRGPNSILFGVGSPGGIINNSLSNASISDDFTEVGLRYGSNDSYRVSFDSNQVMIDGRLAIRIAGLHEKTNFEQKPAFEKDRRLYLAAESILARNERSNFLGATTLRVNAEHGEVLSNPIMATPPNNGFHAWWDGVEVDYQAYTGVPVETNHLPAPEGAFVPRFTHPGANGNINVFEPTTFTINFQPAFVQAAVVYNEPGATSTSANSTAFPNADGFQSRLFFMPEGGTAFNIAYNTVWTTSPAATSYAAGFFIPSIQDRNVFDYRKLLFSGNTAKVDQDFTTYNLSLEQSFFDDGRAGVELVFDSQEWGRFSRTDAGSEVDVGIDLNAFRGNGEPNVNVGRPVTNISDPGAFNKRFVDREAMRATAFYEFDFDDVGDSLGKWLGKHTLTGFVSSQEFTDQTRNYSNTWVSDTLDIRNDILGDRQGGLNRIVNSFVYLGPSVLNANGPEDVRISPINVPVIQDGDTFNIWYLGQPGFGSEPYDQTNFRSGEFQVKTILNNGNILRREIDSQAITLQSRLLSNHIVTLFGWTNEESKDFERLSESQIEALTGSSNRRTVTGPFKEENFILQDTPTTMQEGNTFTYSVVGHLPENLGSKLPFKPNVSFHYSESENFSPSGIRRDAWGRIVAPPTGSTREKGINLQFDKRFSIRLNWFTVSLANGDAGVPVGNMAVRINYGIDRGIVRTQNSPIWNDWAKVKEFLLTDVTAAGDPDPIPNINSFDDFFNALVGVMPPEIAALHNFRIVDNGGTLEVQREANLNQIATTSLVSEGFEVDLIANPTPNWRIMLNVGEQETVTSDSARTMVEVEAIIRANYIASGLWTLRDTPTFNATATPQRRWNSTVIAPLNSVLARDGSVAQEQRKWRANLVTNYAFSEGSALGGFSVGGAARWQDKASIGTGQEFVTGTGIVPLLDQRYFAPEQLNGDLWVSYRRPLSETVDWEVQFNIRNAFGDDDDIPVAADPNGNVAIIRIPNEKSWFLTNTFRF